MHETPSLAGEFFPRSIGVVFVHAQGRSSSEVVGRSIGSELFLHLYELGARDDR